MGMLYRRGTVFWMKYYVNGRPIRESTARWRKAYFNFENLL